MDQTRTAKYIVSLISSLLKEEDPPKKPADISFSDIYAMAKKHHVLNMCLSAMEKLDQKPDNELIQEWEKQRMISCVQSSVQLSEKKHILDILQKNQIRHLPLKGCLMKEMYPKAEYREMSDLDILIHREDYEKTSQLLFQAGYKQDHTNDVNESFMKPPFMNIEIHFLLFSELFAERFLIDKTIKNMVTDPWAYAVANYEASYLYQMSWEDFYVYMILHIAKHYVSSGIGIRQFIDIWVFNQKHQIDREYVNQELNKYGLEEFCQKAEDLINAWFSESKMTDDLKMMESYIFESGAYGTFNNRVMNRIARFEKAKGSKKITVLYTINRLFPSMNHMKILYPALIRHPVFLPAFWIHRLAVKLFDKNSAAYKELKIVKEYIKNKD